MIQSEYLYQHLKEFGFTQWLETLPNQLDSLFAELNHGKIEEWQSVLNNLPDIQASHIGINQGRVQIGEASDSNSETLELLETQLKQLHPWRKGPYELFSIHIDTEWRSDWKWDRIVDHISPLESRRILDVGCGNGYHMWRMLERNPKVIIGVDPSHFFLTQFNVFKRYIGLDKPVHLLPLRSDQLPDFRNKGFDTVFSMGVFYHRRSPIDHLYELKSFLSPGGELVLETLVVEGDENTVLIPDDRYAKMRNVWFLPSVAALESWLARVGFKNIRTVDVTRTTVEEQRATEWMTFESLPDFLDPNDSTKTVEGYTSPTRATFVCNVP